MSLQYRIANWVEELDLKYPEKAPADWIKWCSGKSVEDPKYLLLAGRIEMWNLHESTKEKFTELEYPNLSPDILKLFDTHATRIDAILMPERDYNLDLFSVKTLKRSYLMKDDKGNIIERPCHMYLRVALGIWGCNMERVMETYDAMTSKKFTHATPTLYNEGTISPQCSSCFLLAMKDDSIKGIFATVSDCAQISKYAGGIGLHIHNVRASGSSIKGTNGTSNGIVPMLRVFNNTARYVDQGGGKRKGSFAIYLSAWHWDIFEFLNLRKNHGPDELRARDLFLALWVSDLFMKRVNMPGAKWTLFCPKDASILNELVGEEFEERYEMLERDPNIRKKTVSAKDVWKAMLSSQVETGTPYVLFKDACNKKSNQQNLGVIKSSNLCTEIVQYSSPEETAVCNLASLGLPSFVNKDKQFDFTGLAHFTRILVRNMNKIIDHNKYPTSEAYNSNLKHRPIGIGVQGLCDVFQMMNLVYGSEEALQLDKVIFETIYYAAMDESCELAKNQGAYSSFKKSPLAEGNFQFDFWEETPSTYKWDELREKVMKYGVRNSLLTCVMPTASTAQIMGNSEQVEPIQSNMYTRRTLAGNFMVVNKILVEKLQNSNLWNGSMQSMILKKRGSIQEIETIDDHTKNVFKTIWEIKMKDLITHAAARAPYICQSQSMSLYFDKPDDNKISSALFYGWRKGLKTGTSPSVNFFFDKF